MLLHQKYNVLLDLGFALQEAELTGWAADPLLRSARPSRGGERRCISVKPVYSSWPCCHLVSLTAWEEREGQVYNTT